MKIATTGCLTASLNSPIVYRGAWKEIFPLMVEDGYHAVELHILDSRELDRKELESELKKNQLVLTSIGTGKAYGTRHWNIGDHDKAVRKNALECLREHMITAAPHSALVILGSMQGRFSDAMSPEEFICNVEESLYQLDVFSAQYGVTLGFEIMNHYESDFLTNIEDAIRFFDAHDYKKIGLHIDTVHMNVDEQDLGHAIRRAGTRIFHVHLADNDRWYPGHGHINFREILQGLKDIGYEEALAMETFCWPESRICARRALSYLKFIVREVYGNYQE